MPFLAHCARCGRTAINTSSDFIYWRIEPGGSVICPGCLTTNDVIDDGIVVTDDPDDQLLRDLDPDNDEAGDEDR
jgi:hypothetical protein